MNTKLERLVRKVAILAGQKFEQGAGLHPFFYGIQDDGKRFIFDPYALGLLPYDMDYDGALKQAISNCAEMLFAMHKVKRYVYVSEAWMLTYDKNVTPEEIEKAMKEGVSNHPKRVEVIIFQAEDMDGNAISGVQSIVRPSLGQPYLDDDLKLEDATKWESTGRFTHMLAFRKYHESTT